MIKAIILLRRRPGLTQEEFIAYWRDVHAKIAADGPGFKKHMGRYVQNYPIQGLSPESEFAGVVECWFDSYEDMIACTDNGHYRSIIRPDEEKFLDWSNPVRFIVEENVVYDKAKVA